MISFRLLINATVLATDRAASYEEAFKRTPELASEALWHIGGEIDAAAQSASTALKRITEDAAQMQRDVARGRFDGWHMNGQEFKDVVVAMAKAHALQAVFGPLYSEMFALPFTGMYNALTNQLAPTLRAEDQHYSEKLVDEAVGILRLAIAYQQEFLALEAARIALEKQEAEARALAIAKEKEDAKKKRAAERRAAR